MIAHRVRNAQHIEATQQVHRALVDLARVGAPSGRLFDEHVEPVEPATPESEKPNKPKKPLREMTKEELEEHAVREGWRPGPHGIGWRKNKRHKPAEPGT
jgi:hypothetical protein